MKPVVTAAQMQAFDAATIDELGLPGVALMETAGRAVADAVVDLVPAGGSVAVCCGGGNNGGDGFVVARVLREQCVDARVYLASDRDGLRGDAATHCRVYERCGGPVERVDTPDRVASALDAVASAEVVVDCLFGIGLSRPIEGHYARLIDAINGSCGLRVAVDVPSGLDADTGRVLGSAVQADVTVTMAFAKPGLVTGPGVSLTGRLRVAEIGIPAALAAQVDVSLVERADARALLPTAAGSDHKNRRGSVLVIGGSPGKRGAGRLAALAALRSGAGLVTLAGPARDEAAADPLMTADVATGAEVESLSRGVNTVAIGPGMATDEDGAALVRAVLDLDCPAVLDADALNHLATLGPEAAARSPAPRLLTPHPGEAGRLLGTSAGDVEANRVAAVRELARRSRAVVLLKGAGTLVCDGRSENAGVTVNPTGGPGLATAGTGDVLTGVVAALLGQGVDAESAARLGAYLHGAAGDLCEESLGVAGTTATDVIDALPRAWLDLARA